MELRHLRYFVAVAEELHFRRAAERLHVAQPAVSEQVRKLEHELGVRLLERTQRTVSLTDAGAAFLTEARRVLQDADAARVAARSVRDRGLQRLRIGYVPALMPLSVPRALQRLANATGTLETDLKPGNAAELVESVRARRLDAAIVSLPTCTAGLRLMPLSEERAVAALPTGHRQAVASAIRLDQMMPERIIVLPREADRAFYDAIIAACRHAGLAPTLIEMPDGNLERALLAVASGAGMALVPGSVTQRYLIQGIRFVALAEPQPTVAVAVVTHRDTTHLPTAAFMRALAQTEQAARARVIRASAVPAA